MLHTENNQKSTPVSHSDTRCPITLGNNTIENLNPPHRKARSFWLWMRGDGNKSILKTVKTNSTTNQMGEMNV